MLFQSNTNYLVMNVKMSRRQFAGVRFSWYVFLHNRCRCFRVLALFSLRWPKLHNAIWLNKQPMFLKMADPLNKFIVTA
jgi:hypothetical protein